MRGMLVPALLLPMAQALAADALPIDRATLDSILRRLDALEAENARLRAVVSGAADASAGHAADTPSPARIEPVQLALPQGAGSTRNIPVVALSGDLRYRAEGMDAASEQPQRRRETVRARLAARIDIVSTLGGEIGLGTGGSNPRGGSFTLGEGASRKDVGMDLAWIDWKPIPGVEIAAGKMRQPLARPLVSTFIDNEIRPEGAAISWRGEHGQFAVLGEFWLEERSEGGDARVHSTQIGWVRNAELIDLELAAGWSDFDGVQDHCPGCAVPGAGSAGNSTGGSGDTLHFLHDFDIGSVFVDVGTRAAGMPVRLSIELARNFALDRQADAWSAGLILGDAAHAGGVEFAVLTQRVERDALLGQWLDSDFAGGQSDNRGQMYRLGWRPLESILLNATFYDTRAGVGGADAHDYRRWQLDANLRF